MKSKMLLLLYVFVFSFFAKSQTITIQQPNGGEILYACQTYNILFSATGTSQYYNIDYSLNNGSTWTSSASNLFIPNGNYSWTVPKVSSKTCLLRVRDKNDSSIYDVSNQVFEIKIPIILTSPIGGEVWQGNTTQNITWKADGTSAWVKIEYSTDGGSTFTTITNSYSSSAGSYSWVVPNTPSTNCIVKVSDVNTPCMTDQTPFSFTITPAQPVVTSPNGGEKYDWSQTLTARWNTQTYTGSVRIDYTTDGGTTWVNVVSSTSNTGAYSFKLPNITSDRCKIRVSTASNLSLRDESDTFFSIRTPIEIISPNGGEVLKGCDNVSIVIRKSDYVTGNIVLQYSTGGAWTTITTFSNTSYSTPYIYNWQVPNTIGSSTALIRAYNTSASFSSMIDSSDGVFTIQTITPITIIKPNGGEQISALSSYNIQWQSDASQTSGQFRVQYNSASTGLVTLTNNTTANNYVWSSVPNSPGNDYTIIVSDVQNSCKYDESDGYFSVTPAQPVVTYPNGGEVLWSGQRINIRWDPATMSSTRIKVDYTLDNGATWFQLTSIASNTGVYSWTLPDLLTEAKTCRVRVGNVLGNTLNDVSDTFFTIKPVVKLLTPNGGDVLGACTKTSISFESSPAYPSIKIEYSINGGQTWNVLQSTSSYTTTFNSFNWNLPNTPSQNCLVKLTPVLRTSFADVSDSVFEIKKAVTLLQPTLGTQVKPGSQYLIRWQSEGISNLYDIAYSTNGQASWTNIVVGYNTATSSYLWTVPNTVSSNCYIRIRDNINSCKEDISKNPFVISNANPAITLTSLNGFDTLNGCQNTRISWTEPGTAIGNYKIEYSTDGASTWNLIVNNYKTTLGYYDWIVPNVASDNVVVRVSSATNTTVFDMSDAYLVTKFRQLTVTPDTALCYKDVTTLKVTGGFTSYKWSPSLNLSDSVGDSVQAVVKNTLTYSVSSVNGTCALNGKVKVSVKPGFIPSSITINSDSSNYCYGKLNSFVANYINSGNNPIISWYKNKQLIDTGVSLKIRNLQQGDSVYAILNSNLLCVIDTATSSNIIKPNISAKPVVVSDTLIGCNQLQLQNITYTSDTLVYDTLLSSFGCDSLISKHYVVIKKTAATSDTLKLKACKYVLYKSITYTSSTQFIDTLHSKFGCDSVYRLIDIVIAPLVATAETKNMQGCDSILFKGILYKSNTTVSDTIKNIQGCDSVYVAVQLSIIKSVLPSITLSANNTQACKNTAVTFKATVINAGTQPLFTWYKNGVVVKLNDSIYVDSLLREKDSVWCDMQSNFSCIVKQKVSSNKLSIIILQPTSSLTKVTVCNSQLPYVWNNQNYQQAGLYTMKFINAIGCDSIASLELKVNPNPTISIAASTSCVGSTLTATTTGNINQIAWQNNNVLTSTTLPVFASAGVLVAGGNVAGFGSNTFNSPVAVHVANNGSLYIVDQNNNRVQRWLPNASSGVTVAGGNGYASFSRSFKSPTGLFVDDLLNVYVADFGNHRIQLWKPGDTTGTTVAGGNGSSNGSNQFNGAADVFVANNGDIYVSDQFNHRVQKWKRGDTTGTTVAGGNGSGSAANQLNSPTGVFVDAQNNVYVSDYNNYRIQKWAPGATTGVTVAGGNGNGSAANQLKSPTGLYVDGAGNVYVADIQNNRIQRWPVSAITGTTVGPAGGKGSATNQLNIPQDVFFDTLGWMYVADQNNQRIMKYNVNLTKTLLTTSAGNYTAIATNQYGCTSTSNAVTISSSNPPTIAVVSSKTTVCSVKEKITFNATATNAGNNPQYKWYKNKVLQTANTATYIDSNFKVNDSVWCDVISNAACQTVTTATSNKVIISVPVVLTKQVNLSGCDSVLYKSKWYKANTTLLDTLKYVQGCDSLIQTVNIQLQNSPRLTSIVGNNIYALGDSIKLYVNGTNIASSTYSWTNQNVVKSTASNLVIANCSIADSGVYTVQATTGTCTSNILSIRISIQAMVKGLIKTPSGKSINGVSLLFNGLSTLVNGNYSNMINLGSGVTVKAQKSNDINKTNGINTIDVALIQSHILQKTTLNSPYKIIAADVNNDKRITTLDIVFLKRLILGTDSVLPGRRMWAFVDSSFKFTSNTNPFPYRDSIKVDSVKSNINNLTFLGIRMGDVNWDWNSNLPKHIASNNVQLVYNTIVRENKLTVHVTAENFYQLQALQFTLNYNSSLIKLINVVSKKLPMEFNLQHSHAGKISLLWVDELNIAKTYQPNEVLFDMEFELLSNTNENTIQFLLTDDITQKMAVDEHYNSLGINLKKGRETILHEDENMYVSIFPNPFVDKVVLKSNVKNGWWHVKNLQGNVVYQSVLTNASTSINLSNLTSGIYFITVYNKDFAKTVSCIKK